VPDKREVGSSSLLVGPVVFLGLSKLKSRLSISLDVSLFLEDDVALEDAFDLIPLLLE
jgi:hypothetical protein